MHLINKVKSLVVFRTALLCALVLMVPVKSRADNMRQLEFGVVVEKADDIIVGKVKQSDSKWKGKLIITTTTISIDEVIKGNADRELSVVQLGGTAVHPKIGESVTMTASGQVAFQEGEEVLLFIQKKRVGEHYLVGGAQGKFEIHEDKAKKIKMLPIGPKQLKVLKKKDSINVTSENMTLDDMRKYIRSHMKQKEK